jgi:hypothetical protein
MQTLTRHWLFAGAVSCAFLVALAPVVADGAAPPVFSIYLCLVAYMLHQVEEHAGDRFRAFVNANIGGGREVLTPLAVMVINVAGVWVVLIAALYAAREGLAPGLALVAPYLLLVNAVAHAVAFVALRCYNPGLVTALILLAPAGAWSLALLAPSGPGAALQHAIGLGAAIAIHAAIVAHVRARAAMTAVASPATIH